MFDEYLAEGWVIRQCGTGWIDIQYQLLSGHKSQYPNCDIVMMEFSIASSSDEIKSTDPIESGGMHAT